jgi:hypothetical protein
MKFKTVIVLEPCLTKTWKRDISVCIMITLLSGWVRYSCPVTSQFPEYKEIIHLIQSVQHQVCVPQPSYLKQTEVPFSRGKGAMAWADHSPTSSTKAKMRVAMPVPPICLHGRCFIKHISAFAIYLYLTNINCKRLLKSQTWLLSTNCECVQKNPKFYEPISLDSSTALQTGRSWVRFPMVSLEFFIDIILPAALWPWGRLSLWQKWLPGIFPAG